MQTKWVFTILQQIFSAQGNKFNQSVAIHSFCQNYSIFHFKRKGTIILSMTLNVEPAISPIMEHQDWFIEKRIVAIFILQTLPSHFTEIK